VNPLLPSLLGFALLPVLNPQRPLARFSDKPGPVSVFVAASEPIVPLHSDVGVEVHVRPSSDVRTLTVSLSAIGRIDVLDDPIILDDVRAGTERTIPVRFRVRAEGEGEVRATITGLRADGAALGSTSAVLYVLASQREALLGRTGPLDLRLAYLDRQLQTRAIDRTRHASAVEALRGGGAVRAGPLRSPIARGANVSGHVLWTDRSGGTHPVRFAPVQLLDASQALTPLAVTITDASGGYDVRAPILAPYFVRVLAQGPGFAVKSAGGVVQHVDSAAYALGPGIAFEVNLTANNVDDNNTAFSVADALVTANRYVEKMNGSRFADLDVIFPSDGTYFDGSIHLLRLDRFDWDVLMHEFGHYVSQSLHIDESPGGPHGPGNIGETSGKDVGVRLGWAEGWPTYLSISAQSAMNAGAFGIPYVGDTRYSDTEDADFEWDLETQTGGPGPPPGSELRSLGEDDELSVQRILWDLFDAVDDGGDTVSYGDRDVWDRLDAADAATLSAAYAALVAGRSPAAVAGIGCVFTEHRVAPAPTSPNDGSELSATPPTFTWDANGGGPSNRNDRFTVEVYDAGFSTLLLASPEQSTTSFTPSPASWSALLSAAGGSVHWLVRGSQSNSPPTGPYRSCSRALR
jgi:hypothetical protein